MMQFYQSLIILFAKCIDVVVQRFWLALLKRMGTHLSWNLPLSNAKKANKRLPATVALSYRNCSCRTPSNLELTSWKRWPGAVSLLRVYQVLKLTPPNSSKTQFNNSGRSLRIFLAYHERPRKSEMRKSFLILQIVFQYCSRKPPMRKTCHSKVLRNLRLASFQVIFPTMSIA